MAVAAEQYAPIINQNERVRTDTETWCAEMLHGSMQTSFSYRYNGYELIAEDNGELGVIFDDAIAEAQIIAERQPNLLFELRRRLIEQSEYEDMLKMASGELPNTMVVISDFPLELMGASEDVGGYNTDRQQTMLRVITKEADGNIRMTTQSLDGSNRQALEAIYGQFGYQAHPGELLGQRMYLDVPQQWQGNVVGHVTDYYDASLTEQFGGEWHAGIRQSTTTKSQRNTYEFARAQTDLIDWFAEQKLANPHGAERLRYQLAATMTERYENQHSRTKFNKTLESFGYGGSFFEPISQDQLFREIDRATTSATTQQRTFSGCGASVSSEIGSKELNESGFGNKATAETKYSFNKKMYCVVCQAPPKGEEGKKDCGPCGICRGCDKKLSK
jgi:hypothetical protein